MAKIDEKSGVFQTSPLMILLSYTALCTGLIIETVLMSWELWAIPLLFMGIIVSWGLHIVQFSTPRARIWIYTFLMMATFFFYGIHVTSAYDIGLLMMIVIMIYTTAGEISLIYVCQITYYVTLAYDLVVMVRSGYKWDNLTISRTILHVGLMFLAGWLARTIIRRWALIFGRTGERIDELNESTKRVNSFMANLSHELRTPINAIIGITNVMLDKEKDDELKGDMNEILHAGNRLAEQVGDILDYSEIEMESLVVNSSDYMIASVLNDLVSELRPMMTDDIELIIDVDAEIPAVLRGDAVKLRKILYHIINNGLKYTKEGGVYVKLRAKKQPYGINLCIEVTDTGVGMSKDELDRIYSRFYQAQSGRVIRSGGLGISLVIVSGFVRALDGFITIDSEQGKGTRVRVSIPQEVVDDGRCMEVSEESRITLGAYLDFSKYKHPIVREFYNKMVLNIVRGLRTTMHRVDNEEDLKKLVERVKLTHLFVADDEYERSKDYLETLASEMTVVVVSKDSYRLPEDSMVELMPKPFYCIPVVAVLNADRDFVKTPERRMRCDGVKALVVDDEPMNLSVARGIFRRYGMEVKTAESGEESIRMCQEEEFDVVFMDHMMPGMDGVEAMKRIRYESAKARKTPAMIALTANALSSAREMFLAEGFDGFVSKPIELITLERVLKHCLPKSAITYEYEDIPAGEEPAPEDKLAACGINEKLGKSYCENDEELYNIILKEYVSEYEEKSSKMEKFLKEKDLKNYGILVHALKSTSLMIGAEALSEDAKALENASQKNELEFVEERHEALISDYKRVVDAIKSVKHFDKAEEDEVLEFYPEEDE